MSHIKEFNTESRKGKHLTEKERYYIEALLKDKARIPHITKLLGRDRRTIEREIKRGQVRFLNSDYSYRLEYCADTAQADYACKAQNKGSSLKTGYDHELAKYIEAQIIEEKRLPDAVIGRIKTRGMKFKTNICTVNYMWNSWITQQSYPQIPHVLLLWNNSSNIIKKENIYIGERSIVKER